MSACPCRTVFATECLVEADTSPRSRQQSCRPYALGLLRGRPDFGDVSRIDAASEIVEQDQGLARQLPYQQKNIALQFNILLGHDLASVVQISDRVVDLEQIIELIDDANQLPGLSFAADLGDDAREVSQVFLFDEIDVLDPPCLIDSNFI